jgi:hypothetical protein
MGTGALVRIGEEFKVFRQEVYSSVDEAGKPITESC